MKKFLCIILLASLATPIIAYTQAYQTPIDDPINHLSLQAWRNISFNGITLSQISKTKGDKDSMKRLFTFPATTEYIEERDDFSTSKQVSNDDIFFSFDDYDFGTDYSLTMITVKTNKIKVTINGTTARIGDHYSKLGNVAVNTYSGGGAWRWL